MNDVIKIKRGSGTSTLADGELGFKTGEEALYIGADGKNIKLCDAELEQRIKAYIDSQVADINARLDAMTPSE